MYLYKGIHNNILYMQIIKFYIKIIQKEIVNEDSTHRQWVIVIIMLSVGRELNKNGSPLYCFQVFDR